MDPIYVTGHRNPDTDSIVSAMAYAALRNACGHRDYEACRLGQISAETKIVLDRVGFQPPRLIHDVFTQVQDLDFDRPPVLGSAVTVGRAWEIFQEEGCSAVPVANEDGTLYGMLSREDVAGYYMTLVNLVSCRKCPCSTYCPFWKERFSTMPAIPRTWWAARSSSPCPSSGKVCFLTAPTPSSCAVTSRI